jgi:catalase
VLFDAVAMVASAEGAALLAKDAAAKDFVNDAFAHCKLIGYSEPAHLLFEKAGLAEQFDEGCLLLKSTEDVKSFFEALAQLRFWEREANVDLDALE